MERGRTRDTRVMRFYTIYHMLYEPSSFILFMCPGIVAYLRIAHFAHARMSRRGIRHTVGWDGSSWCIVQVVQRAKRCADAVPAMLVRIVAIILLETETA